jgi:predicted transcriptional regulator
LIYTKLKILHKLHLVKISGSFIDGRRCLLYENSLSQNNYRNNVRVQAILEIVKNNPGIHYSELVRIVDLTHGVITHYLVRMEKMKQVRIKRDKRKAFIFLHNSSEKLDNILIHLRKETAGRIIAFLLDRKTATFLEIREVTRKSPSTVSLVLTQLVEINLVRRIPGVVHKYELVDLDLTLQAIESMKPSTTSTMKDRFSDTFFYL